MTATAEQLRLTTLAAVKRACVLGANLELVATDVPHLQLTLLQGPRPIIRVQANAIAIRGCHRAGGETYDPDVESWLYWPKVADLTFHDDDTFTFDKFGRSGSATYRVVPA